jgi:hypothetical protein
MLRHPRSKLVCGEMLAARQKSEVFGRDSEMEDSFLGTDRAIALRDAIDNRVDFESDAATVTAPYMARHFGLP